MRDQMAPLSKAHATETSISPALGVGLLVATLFLNVALVAAIVIAVISLSGTPSARSFNAIASSVFLFAGLINYLSGLWIRGDALLAARFPNLSFSWWVAAGTLYAGLFEVVVAFWLFFFIPTPLLRVAMIAGIIVFIAGVTLIELRHYQYLDEP